MNRKNESRPDADIFAALDEKIEEASRSAAGTLRHLEDLNSSFSATRDFLQARGLTNVRELDRRGRQELRLHLEALLKAT